MKTKNWIAIGVMALLAVSCKPLDPAEEAARVNRETDSLLSVYDSIATPFVRYQALMDIKNKADSIIATAGKNFKKEKYEIFSNAVVYIEDNPRYESAWTSMINDNGAELDKIPSNTWLINADSSTVNTIFKFNRNREQIVPYNIKGSNFVESSQKDGLIYGEGLIDNPLFFHCDDSTKVYEISIAPNRTARFRKAGMKDLAQGYYTAVYDYRISYEEYNCLEIENGTIKYGGGEYPLVMGTENFLGMNVKKMKVGDLIIMFLLERYCRDGCYDCWGPVDDFKFRYKYSRRILDKAENISYIFGEPEEVWRPKKTESASLDIPADGDWDAVLDLYEECVDEYVAAVKKAASGDLSAAVSYAKIAQKATELSEKLSGVNDELTPKQQKRYVSILNKMTEMANRE